MADHVHARASSNRRATRGSPSSRACAAAASQSGVDVRQRRQRRVRDPSSRSADRGEARPPPTANRPSSSIASSEPYWASSSAARFSPIPARSGYPVRRIAAERDEVGHLLRVDAVALANLRRPDPRRRASAADGLENGRPSRSRAGTRRGRRSRRAHDRRPPPRSRQPPRGSRRPRSPAPSRTRRPADATSAGSRSSCSRSSASNTRPLW